MSVAGVIVFVAFAAIFGGLWRRWFGGWGPQAPRAFKFAIWVIFICTFAYPSWHLAASALLLSIIWAPSHGEYFHDNTLLGMSHRYGVYTALAAFCAGAAGLGWVQLLPLAFSGWLAGPIYVLGREKETVWNISEETKGFIDGGFAVSEILLGIAVAMSWAIAVL